MSEDFLEFGFVTDDSADIITVEDKACIWTAIRMLDLLDNSTKLDCENFIGSATALGNSA
jgi:hypothetical protein